MVFGRCWPFASLVSTPMLPYATTDLPGVGGLLKVEPADFRVRELPLYPTTGEGDFLFLRIEKTGLSAEQLIQHLARALEVPRAEIGAAGLKDRQAITEQTLSVPVRCEPLLARIDTTAVRLLGVERHRHKLRTGHLAGNAFDILLRTQVEDAGLRALRIAESLRETGFPNFYGDQRFGQDQETLRLGFDLLTGQKTPRDIHPARRKFLLRLAISAAQSELFNGLLTARLRGGTWRTVLPGDVMQVVASGGLFVAEDLAREQPRLMGGEIVVTGPMFGPKMRSPEGPAADLEHESALATVSRCVSPLPESWGSGSPNEWFRPYSKLASGTRRPLSISLIDLILTQTPAGLRFQFTLPPGAYATTVLREFQKEVPPAEIADEAALASDDGDGGVEGDDESSSE